MIFGKLEVERVAVATYEQMQPDMGIDAKVIFEASAVPPRIHDIHCPEPDDVADGEHHALCWDI